MPAIGLEEEEDEDEEDEDEEEKAEAAPLLLEEVITPADDAADVTDDGWTRIFMALSTAPASRSDGDAVCRSMFAAASSSCLRFPQAAGDGMRP